MKSPITVVAQLVCLCVLALLGAPASNSNTPSPKELLLFGGQDHGTFLGCLNCADSSASSVCNVSGQFGAGMSLASIWNNEGDFGADASDDSPWGDASSNPPIILDTDGLLYGYFTRNKDHRDRTRIPWLVVALDSYGKTKNLDKTRVEMCSLSRR